MCRFCSSCQVKITQKALRPELLEMNRNYLEYNPKLDTNEKKVAKELVYSLNRLLAKDMQTPNSESVELN